MPGTLADKIDAIDAMPDEPIIKEGDAGGTDAGGTNPPEPATGGDNKPGTPSEPKPDKEGTGGADKGPEVDKGGDSEPETGYFADDDEPESTPVDEPAPTPQNLSPDLQYIVDNLPTLTVRGRTRTDGPTKTFQIKAAGQLPEDFEFVSKRDELLFNQALAGQEIRARELQSQYRQQEQSKAATAFTEKENNEIRRDIGSLQRDGKLPRFKFQPDDPKFNDDPAVKEAQEVIDFMNKRNAEYLQDANKGGVLYHLSFKDAHMLLKGQNPASGNPAQVKEDQERTKVSRATAGASGAPSTGIKPRAARSMQELMDRLDSTEF